MEYKINTLLPVQFEKITNPLYIDDSRWQTYKVWICHDLENYNGSYFDVSTLEKMGEKLAGVPVVGYISANNINEKDFSGHEERLVIQDGEISFEYLGRAYGCVLENNDWQIEQKEHEDGSVRNYLTCKCIVWNMFKDAIEIFERDGKKSHSMELQEGSIQGKFEKDGYFHFTDATIRALCILGEEIQPAMSNSIIEKFSQVDFSSQVQELLFEINESIKQFSSNQSSNLEVDDINFSAKEDKKLNEKMELIAKYGLIIEELDFSIEEISLEDLEEKLKEFTKEEDKKEVSFSATYRQKRDALNNALDPKIERDNDGNLIYEEYYWVSDFDDEYVYVERSIWTADNYENTHGRYAYTFNEETLTATIISEFEEMILTWLTLEENQKLQEERNSVIVEYEKIKDEFEDYKNKYSIPNEEVERLQNFEKETLENQRKEAEEILFAQFDEKLKGVEEYETLKTKTSEFILEDLERECFVILGKQSANFTAKPTKKEKVKIEFNKSQNQEQEDEFGDLFEKYLK